jgi:hypothetical protein
LLVSIVSAALSASAFLAVTGCGSDSKSVSAPPPKASGSMKGSSAGSAMPAAGASASGAIAPQGLEAYRAGLVAGQEQVDKTLAALSELTDPAQTDVRGAYNRYCDQLTRMSDHAQTMKTEADMMRSSKDQYFGKWEERVTEIDNPTIRASAEARRKRLRDAHERIMTTSGDARDAYEPFMKDLQDIKKFLAADQSKGAIADLGDAAKKVQADGAVVKQKIAAVVATLDSVQSGR